MISTLQKQKIGKQYLGQVPHAFQLNSLSFRMFFSHMCVESIDKWVFWNINVFLLSHIDALDTILEPVEARQLV